MTVPLAEGTSGSTRSVETIRARTLLKAATESFVAEPRHSRSEIAIFEELARQLIRITAPADRRAIAALLARHPDAPVSILRDLMNDDIAIARELLAAAPVLPEVDLLALIATGSVEHLEAVAARPRLSPAVFEALLHKLPAASLSVLAHNGSVRLPPDVVDALVGMAQDDPGLAIALSRRFEDVEDAALTDLFLLLDAKGRRRVIQAIEILALRDFAAKRPLPRVEQPDPDDLASLSRVALSRDAGAMATILSRLLDVEPELARKLVDDEGGEPLAIALKAAAIGAPIATRVLLFSGHQDIRNYFDVKRLVELYEQVSHRSAVLLIGRWRGDVAPLPRRSVRHLPQTEAGTPVRAKDPIARPAPLLRPAATRRDSA